MVPISNALRQGVSVVVLYVFWLLQFVSVVAAGSLQPFVCFQDVCNMRDAYQFCGTNEMCVDCAGNVEHLCGDSKLPPQCFAYCLDLTSKKVEERLRALECPSLPNIENGFHSGNTTGPSAQGTRVQSQCKAEYQLQGEPFTICEDFGRWSNQLPKCKALECPSLPNIENGFHSGNTTGPSAQGTRVQAQCKAEYQLQGEPFTICEDFGRWSNQLPKCKGFDLVASSDNRDLVRLIVSNAVTSVIISGGFLLVLFLKAKQYCCWHRKPKRKGKTSNNQTIDEEEEAMVPLTEHETINECINNASKETPEMQHAAPLSPHHSVRPAQSRIRNKKRQRNTKPTNADIAELGTSTSSGVGMESSGDETDMVPSDGTDKTSQVFHVTVYNNNSNNSTTNSNNSNSNNSNSNNSNSNNSNSNNSNNNNSNSNNSTTTNSNSNNSNTIDDKNKAEATPKPPGGFFKLPTEETGAQPVPHVSVDPVKPAQPIAASTVQPVAQDTSDNTGDGAAQEEGRPGHFAGISPIITSPEQTRQEKSGMVSPREGGQASKMDINGQNVNCDDILEV